MSGIFKPLYHQVLVIVGATSDIGIATVHAATEQGAKVFMIDGNEDDLQSIQDELRRKGYESAYSVANLTEEDQVQFAADQCLKTFGAIDTWVNIPGTMETVPKKMFETNFWSLVNGCHVAVPILSEHGGVLINIGNSFRGEAYPHERIDAASKEAIKGFTDALRKELKENKSVVQVTLITPGEAKAVAQSILKSAERPRKEIRTGESLSDRMLARRQALIASGIGSVAMVGGLTFFFMKKMRLI